jgi:hypothetical protein
MRLAQELFPRIVVMDEGQVVENGWLWISWRMKNY